MITDDLSTQHEYIQSYLNISSIIDLEIDKDVSMIFFSSRRYSNFLEEDSYSIKEER